MSDTGNTAAGKTRKSISKRTYIGGERIDDATGAIYTLLDPAGNHDFEYEFGKNENADRMFALFGFHTKIGNVANTVLNDKDEPGTPSQAADDVRAFIELTQSGKWAERVSAPGTRVNKEVLATCYVEWAATKGETKDYATVLQKLIETPSLIAQVKRIPEVATAYAERVGAPAVNEDALLGKL